MCDERQLFFAALLARCTDYRQSCLTLTAIHPDGQHSTPSRHTPLDQSDALRDALEQLDAANRRGWGAYYAVGLRRPGLSRWRRGCGEDIAALPALYADVDDHALETLARLRAACPTPSCLVDSGGGYHAYWWLEEPTTDLELAQRTLRALATALGGDSMSIAQSLRLVGSINTKPERNHAACRLLELTDRRYPLSHFAPLLPPASPARNTTAFRYTPPSSSGVPNADLVARLVDAFTRQGFKQRGDWLNGACPFPQHHKHGDQHPSFGFNVRSGYGFCHICGTLLLKHLCAALGIVPAQYGAIYRSRSRKEFYDR